MNLHQLWRGEQLPWRRMARVLGLLLAWAASLATLAALAHALHIVVRFLGLG